MRKIYKLKVMTFQRS